MTDSVRAIGWKPQTTIGTPATPILASNFVEGFDWKPNLTTKTNKYLTGTRLQETRVRRLTKHDQIDIKNAGLDLYEYADYLSSCLGPPSAGVYRLGDALNSTAGAFLTTKIMIGPSESWQFLDGRADTMDVTGDAANGTLDWSGSILTKLDASQPGSAWTPTLRTLPNADEPFDPWQFVLLKGGVSPGCVLNFKLSVKNNFNPLTCFPVTNPTTVNVAGLSPTRYTDGVPSATLMVTMEYTGYSGSSFQDFLTHVTGAWTLTATAPLGTTPGSLTYSIPKLDWTTGGIDGNNPESRFIGTGAVLASSGVALTATVVLPT